MKSNCLSFRGEALSGFFRSYRRPHVLYFRCVSDKRHNVVPLQLRNRLHLCRDTVGVEWTINVASLRVRLHSSKLLTVAAVKVIGVK